MTAIGIGIGIGLGLRNLLTFPYKKSLSRRFTKLDNYRLIDDVAGRDATLLAPTALVPAGQTGIINIITDLTGVSVTNKQGTSTVSIVGNEIHISPGTSHSIQLSNGFFIPIPSLKYGFDISGQAISLSISNIETSYINGGSKWLLEKGCVNRSGNIIPNAQSGKSALNLIAGDIEIKPSKFLNNSPFIVDFLQGDSSAPYAYFDRSNPDIWKGFVRTGPYYDILNKYRFHSSELLQSYLYNNIEDNYKYRFWNRTRNNKIFDLFLYSSKPVNICKVKSYVGIGEEYSVIYSYTNICSIDKVIE